MITERRREKLQFAGIFSPRCSWMLIPSCTLRPSREVGRFGRELKSDAADAEATDDSSD